MCPPPVSFKILFFFLLRTICLNAELSVSHASPPLYTLSTESEVWCLALILGSFWLLLFKIFPLPHPFSDCACYSFVSHNSLRFFTFFIILPLLCISLGSSYLLIFKLMDSFFSYVKLTGHRRY